MVPVKNPRVFNVFYGDESYFLDRELQRAQRWPDRYVISLDGEEATEDTVVEALGDVSMDERRGTVVLVDNAEKIKVASTLIAYANQRDLKDKSSLLVALCRSSRLPKGWAEVAKKGRAIEHAQLKPWQKDQLEARLSREVDALGLVLSKEAFELLFRVYGADQIGCMINEVRKASFLLSKGATLSRDLVLSLCSKRYAAAPWDVAEAAFAKDSKRALRTASMLFQDRGDEAVVPIVAALMRQLEQTLVLRSLLDRQQTPEMMGTALGLHPFRIQKDLPTVRKHTVPQLLAQMKKLCELEAQVKGAAPAKRTLVELAVLSLAA